MVQGKERHGHSPCTAALGKPTQTFVARRYAHLRSDLHPLCLTSGIRYSFAAPSQSADIRRSMSFTAAREVLYAKRLQCNGWNSAQVITSFRSSMFSGLMSRMLNPVDPSPRCQIFTRRSSALRNVSSSEFILRQQPSRDETGKQDVANNQQIWNHKTQCQRSTNQTRGEKKAQGTKRAQIEQKDATTPRTTTASEWTKTKPTDHRIRINVSTKAKQGDDAHHFTVQFEQMTFCIGGNTSGNGAWDASRLSRLVQQQQQQQ